MYIIIIIDMVMITIEALSVVGVDSTRPICQNVFTIVAQMKTLIIFRFSVIRLPNTFASQFHFQFWKTIGEDRQIYIRIQYYLYFICSIYSLHMVIMTITMIEDEEKEACTAWCVQQPSKHDGSRYTYNYIHSNLSNLDHLYWYTHLYALCIE